MQDLRPKHIKPIFWAVSMAQEDRTETQNRLDQHHPVCDAPAQIGKLARQKGNERGESFRLKREVFSALFIEQVN